MSHTRNTKPAIYPHHEAWARANGYRPQAASIKRAGGPAGIKHQASKEKLDKSSGLGYHRINGKVQQRSRFVGPSHITNRRHAHLVRSSTRAARSTLESKPIKDLMKAVASPGDREQLNQSTSEQTSKHRGPTSTVNGQASKALIQKTNKHGPWNKFQAPLTKVLD